MATMLKLAPEVKTALRRRFMETEGTRWVTELAARRGWEEANRRYLESKRAQGVREMAALMQDLGITGPVSRDDAFDLLETAVAIYLPEAVVRRTVADDGQVDLQIVVRECPTYACIERSAWHGVTVCDSWHRRQGWYQAMGVDAMDTIVGEKKWGDVACAAQVRPIAAPSRRSA